MYKMKTYKLHAVVFNKFGSEKWLGYNCIGMRSQGDPAISLSAYLFMCFLEEGEGL